MKPYNHFLSNVGVKKFVQKDDWFYVQQKSVFSLTT